MKNNLQKKTILITGGLGFIGSNLAHRVLKSGAKVILYDNADPHSGANYANIRDIQDKVIVIKADIRDKNKMENAVSKTDYIINCAAYTSHPGSMLDPFTDTDINCRGVLVLLEAIKTVNPKAKLIQVGTTTQIGKMLTPFIDEMHPEYPLDIYSASKSGAEKYVLIYGNAYDIPVTVIRLANVFGPRSNIRSSDFGFINYFIGLGMQQKAITLYGGGQQKRSIVYVDDAVESFIHILENPFPNQEIFHISMRQQYSVSEIASAISQHIGGMVEKIPWPKTRKLLEVGDVIVSTKKIEKIYNWQAKEDLVSGLIKTKAYFLANLPFYL